MKSILLKKYNDLETEVIGELCKRVQISHVTSKTHDIPCIKVNIYDYTELVLINNKLTFLDSNGYHYDIYSECTLLDLIKLL